MAWIRNARSKKDQLSSGNKSANSWFLFNLEIQFQICRSFHFQFQISSFGYLTGKFNNDTDKYRNMKLLNAYWSLIVLRRHCRGDLNFRTFWKSVPPRKYWKYVKLDAFYWSSPQFQIWSYCCRRGIFVQTGLGWRGELAKIVTRLFCLGMNNAFEN